MTFLTQKIGLQAPFLEGIIKYSLNVIWPKRIKRILGISEQTTEKQNTDNTTLYPKPKTAHYDPK